LPSDAELGCGDLLSAMLKSSIEEHKFELSPLCFHVRRYVVSIMSSSSSAQNKTATITSDKLLQGNPLKPNDDTPHNEMSANKSISSSNVDGSELIFIKAPYHVAKANRRINL
jgi:hypothetical protein